MSLKKRVSKSGKVSWLCQVFLGRDEQGKRKEVTKTFSTKKEAELYEADVKLQLSKGVFLEPTKFTVGAYLDEWLEKSASVKLKTQTVQLYGNLVRIYIKPDLGHLPFSKLTPLVIQSFFTNLAAKSDLSHSSLRNILTALRSALQQAVKWRYIQESPATNIDLPRVQQQERKIKALDAEQANKFLEACKGGPWEIVLTFALLTGARPGEYLALSWSDLDFERGTARIEKALVRPKGGGWKLEDPKTQRSKRTINLTAELLELLKKHRKTQKALQKAVGATWKTEGNFVFTNGEGGPIDEKKLSQKHFQAILKTIGLEGEFSLYNLRHTCATLLLLAGEQPHVVSDRLGHSSVSITLDIYSHVLPSMQKQATESLRKFLAEKLGAT
jgi:integrase